MKKIIILILALSLLIGCVQQPIEPVEPTSPVEEPTEEEQTCTEMWICKDENTKAYRSSDCTFEDVTDCPAGCENAECKEEVVEEPEEETELEEPKEETKQSCTIGFKCLDEKRRGYQSSNCVFSQVDECGYKCKDGKCIEAPPEKKKEEIFSLKEGKNTLGKLGKRYCDFSENQIFVDDEEVYDQDMKVRLYARSSGYNYLRAESYRSDLWVIEKGITEATRSDCMEKIIEANAYKSFRSGQTLCAQTREKNIALVGGYWEGLPTEDTELTWKYYS